MYKIVVKDRKYGIILERVSSVEEGLMVISQYEEYDKQQGMYKENAYEIEKLMTMDYNIPHYFY